MQMLMLRTLEAATKEVTKKMKRMKIKENKLNKVPKMKNINMS
jgi:hypothetical protein